jgi:hypothetical protein
MRHKLEGFADRLVLGQSVAGEEAGCENAACQDDGAGDDAITKHVASLRYSYAVQLIGTRPE